MAIFGLKPWVNPFGKMSIFRLFEFFFFSLERSLFALEYRKRHFPGLYCPKKKVGKMTIFRPKAWVSPFGERSIFLTFWTTCFYSLETRFFALEYPKRHFSGVYFLKKKTEKWTFLEQNHGLTFLEKCQFFHFLNFMFL